MLEFLESESARSYSSIA